MNARDKADIIGIGLFFVLFASIFLLPVEWVKIAAPNGETAYMLGLVIFFAGIPTCRHAVRWMMGVQE